MTYNKEFVEILKTNLYDVNHEMVGDYYYEWTVENWNKISKEVCVFSPKFHALGYKWKLELYPNGVDDFYKGNVSLYLNRDNDDDDCSVHVPVNRVFFIRNCNDKYTYRAATLPIEFLSKSIPSSGHPNLIKKDELFTNNPYTNRSIIENNKCVVGVYFQVYKKEKGLFHREITCFIDDEDKIVKNNGFYEWKVGNWSKHSNKERSPTFTIGDYRWALEIHKDGDGSDNKKYVSLYLFCLNPEIKKGGTWANAILYLRNCEDDTDCFCFDVLEMRNFNTNEKDWGFPKLIKKKELFKCKQSKKCVVQNDKCIAGVYLHIYGDGKAPLQGNQPVFNAPPQQYPQSQNVQNPPPPYYPTNQGMNNNSQMPQYPPYQNTPYQYPPYQYPPYQYPPPFYYPPSTNQDMSNAPSMASVPPMPPMPPMQPMQPMQPMPQYPPYQGQPYQNYPYPNAPYQEPPPSYYSTDVFPNNSGNQEKGDPK